MNNLFRATTMPSPFVPTGTGLAGLLEKRVHVYSYLGLTGAATFIGDFNHFVYEDLLLSDAATPHNNHASDPGSSNLSLTQSAGFNMDRLRGLSDALTLTQHVHVTLDGYRDSIPPGQYDLTANETVVVGNVVYVSGDNTVNLGDASALATSHVIGLVIQAASAGDVTIVRTDGEVSQSDWTSVTGAATLTPGAEYYLSTTAGQMTTTPPSGDGEAVVRLGVAITTTKFDIEVNEIAVL